MSNSSASSTTPAIESAVAAADCVGDRCPAQVVVTRAVPASQREDYEGWLDRLLTAAKAHKGYTGATVLRPADEDDLYRVTATFSSVDSMLKWESHPTRQRLLEESAQIVDAPAVWEVNAGMDAWFGPVKASKASTPVRWRMSLLLFCVVSALVLMLAPLVRAALPDAHGKVRLIVTIALDVVLMTYVVMPRMLRWFGPWLHRAPKKS